MRWLQLLLLKIFGALSGGLADGWMGELRGNRNRKNGIDLIFKQRYIFNSLKVVYLEFRNLNMQKQLILF